jgi:hypothetical protein
MLAWKQLINSDINSGNSTLILQSSFHIRLVSRAASTQALITLGSASVPEQSEQPEQYPISKLAS